MRSRIFPVAVKRYLPKSFFGRSVLILLVPLVLLQVVSTWIFYDRHWTTVTRRLAAAVASEVSLLVNSGDAAQNALGMEWMISSARTLGLRFEFREGEVLQGRPTVSGGGILDTRLAAAMDHAVGGRPFEIDTWSHDRLVRMNVQMPDGVIEILVSRKRLFSSTTYIFVMWMVGTSIILFAVAAVFMRNQVRPIRRLAEAVDSFGKGRSVSDFRAEGAVEIRMAAQAFERMRERIQNALSQRTEMLAGISHDLRTPLTRMKLQLELLEGSDEVEDLKADVREMEVMIDEYLAFARGEGGEDVVETDIGEIVRSVAAAVAAGGGSLETSFEGDLRMPVRPNALRRCFTNLVANAQTHARTIRISVANRRTGIECLVDDDGDGIPEESREDVFKPFYRLDVARNPETGGAGLGLSIARDIARGHGGDVTLGQSPMGGLRAAVHLPF